MIKPHYAVIFTFKGYDFQKRGIPEGSQQTCYLFTTRRKMMADLPKLLVKNSGTDYAVYIARVGQPISVRVNITADILQEAEHGK